MNTHLLDLLSLNWKVELFTAPDSTITVLATRPFPENEIKAMASMSALEVNDQAMQNFFWKKFFRLCMFKRAYYSRQQLGS